MPGIESCGIVWSFLPLFSVTAVGDCMVRI